MVKLETSEDETSPPRNEANSECTTLKKMGLEDETSFRGSRPIFRCFLLDSKVGRFMMYLHCRNDTMIFFIAMSEHINNHQHLTWLSTIKQPPPLRETCSKGSLRHDFASLRIFFNRRTSQDLKIFDLYK